MLASSYMWPPTRKMRAAFVSQASGKLSPQNAKAARIVSHSEIGIEHNAIQAFVGLATALHSSVSVHLSLLKDNFRFKVALHSVAVSSFRVSWSDSDMVRFRHDTP